MTHRPDWHASDAVVRAVAAADPMGCREGDEPWMWDRYAILIEKHAATLREMDAADREAWCARKPHIRVLAQTMGLVGPTLADPFTPDLHETVARELERLADAIAPKGPAPVVPQWAGMDDFGGSDF